MADVRIDWRRLEDFAAQVFAKAGMPEQDARTEARVLVWANLRGVDSHGVLRIPAYVASVEAGGMNPRANIRVEKETPAMLLVEADHAFGPVVTVFTMNKAMAKAREVGIGWALIRKHHTPGRHGLLFADGRGRGPGRHRHRLQSAQHGALWGAGARRPQ